MNENPIKLNIQRFYLSTTLPVNIKVTDDYLQDFDDGAMFRKLKVTATIDTSRDNFYDYPQRTYLNIDPGRFASKYFINNIKATQMTMDENAKNVYVNSFKDVSSSFRIYRDEDVYQSNVSGNLALDFDATGEFVASLISLEFDLWVLYDGNDWGIDAGNLLNNVYSENNSGSYYALSDRNPYYCDTQDKSFLEENNFDADVIYSNRSFFIPVNNREHLITITSSSGQKTFDGTPLTNHTYTTDYSGSDPEILSDLSKITINFTGSQTSVGSSQNTFDIEWNGVNSEKYNITKHYGTLTIIDNTNYDEDAPSGPDAP